MPLMPIQSILSLIGALVIFILILFLAYFFTKYVGKHYGTSSMGAGHMETLDRIVLGPDRSLLLVRVAGKVLLLGITSQQITRLEELNPELFPQQEGSQKGTVDFLAVLKKAVNKNQEEGSNDKTDG